MKGTRCLKRGETTLTVQLRSYVRTVRWNNRKLPRVIDCSIQALVFPLLLHGNTGEETTMRQRSCVPRIIRNDLSERNEETGARGLKIDEKFCLSCQCEKKVAS